MVKRDRTRKMREESCPPGECEIGAVIVNAAVLAKRIVRCDRRNGDD